MATKRFIIEYELDLLKKRQQQHQPQQPSESQIKQRYVKSNEWMPDVAEITTCGPLNTRRKQLSPIVGRPNTGSRSLSAARKLIDDWDVEHKVSMVRIVSFVIFGRSHLMWNRFEN
jgi:hypothetical protein